MHIAFVGDVHGRVFHALAAVMRCQQRLQAPLDLVVQVGDFGAYPDISYLDEAMARYVQDDPTEGDFLQLRTAEGVLASSLRRVRQHLARPVLFVRGNHEAHAWLADEHRRLGHAVVPVDPIDLFPHVADGAVIDLEGVRLAFLGGIETRRPEGGIDAAAYQSLLHLERGSVDVLVTHDGPYGIGTDFRGHAQGSRLISELIASLQPRLHVGGHYHHMNGPHRFGTTTYFGLCCLLHPPKRDPRRTIQPGSVAIFDPDRHSIDFVTDPWFEGIEGSFDFVGWTAAGLPV